MFHRELVPPGDPDLPRAQAVVQLLENKSGVIKTDGILQDTSRGVNKL